MLHVLRYPRAGLDTLIDAINATGYGLTFGLHTRLDETVSRVLGRIEAGNIYVNRNIIGAVVGVQPFGGSGLSGTGPKAGGPCYLGRLLANPPELGLEGNAAALAPAHAYIAWLRDQGHDFDRCLAALSRSALGAAIELPGPVGERNLYTLRPRGQVAALSRSEAGLRLQFGVILASGNSAVIETANPARGTLASLPPALAARIHLVDSLDAATHLRAVLFDGSPDDLRALTRRLAARPGAILHVQAATATQDYEPNRLLEECSISTNTTAAGGNASLMSIG